MTTTDRIELARFHLKEGKTAWYVRIMNSGLRTAWSNETRNRIKQAMQQDGFGE